MTTKGQYTGGKVAPASALDLLAGGISNTAAAIAAAKKNAAASIAGGSPSSSAPSSSSSSSSSSASALAAFQAQAEERRLAAELRAKLKDPATPTDPLAERQAAKAARRMEEAKRMTFKACAEAFMEAKRHEWKNAKHGQQWENTLDTYVYPTLGTLPVCDIDTALVVKVLQPIWTTKNETASRLRGRIESILAWATTSGYRTGENPARWRGHLSNLSFPRNFVCQG